MLVSYYIKKTTNIIVLLYPGMADEVEAHWVVIHLEEKWTCCYDDSEKVYPHKVGGFCGYSSFIGETVASTLRESDCRYYKHSKRSVKPGDMTLKRSVCGRSL